MVLMSPFCSMAKPSTGLPDLAMPSTILPVHCGSMPITTTPATFGLQPVPMMVREAAAADRLRGRAVARGTQVVLSLWHLHRNERLWAEPHGFDPDRWAGACPRGAFLPFSAGPRVCPGAGLAMVEGPLFLALILARWRVEAVPGRVPVPVAQLTVRSRDGIWLNFREREAALQPSL